MHVKRIVGGLFATCAAVVALISSSAEARTVNNATIVSITVGYYNTSSVAVTLNTAMASLSCTPNPVSTGFQQTFIFDPGQQSGKNALSTLTAAYLAGKRINFVGTGACTSIFLKSGTPETKYAEELGHFVVVN